MRYSKVLMNGVSGSLCMAEYTVNGVSGSLRYSRVHCEVVGGCTNITVYIVDGLCMTEYIVKVCVV